MLFEKIKILYEYWRDNLYQCHNVLMETKLKNHTFRDVGTHRCEHVKHKERSQVKAHTVPSHGGKIRGSLFKRINKTSGKIREVI